MPSKRVSLKGKGADLFFGDYKPGQDVSPSPIETESPPSPLATPVADGILQASVQTVVDSSRTSPAASPPPDGRLANERTQIKVIPDSTSASTQASTTAREQARPAASRPDSVLASKLSQNPSDVVQAIRKVVKVSGKDVSYVRLTPEEKAQVADIIYAYKRQGQKTTETEIHRIALNYLLNDYHAHSSDSVLASVLAALQA
jgi:hypothetical protein